MAKGSTTTPAEWEKEAMKACCHCGEKILSKHNRGTSFNVVTGEARAWHGECAPKFRLVPA